MNREVHVRFSESARVKFPRATRLHLEFPQGAITYVMQIIHGAPVKTGRE